MSRFTLAKRRRPTNGWRQHQLENAQAIAGEDFDPNHITPEEFIQELIEHHLREVRTAHINT